MCTATILSFDSVAVDDGDPSMCSTGATDSMRWRLVTNRDERRDRAAARPPMLRRCGDRQAIMPIDPSSDGTWVAANDVGLVMTLLNLNPQESASWPIDRGTLQSRGDIIPQLIAHTWVDEALSEIDSMDMSCFAPFTLVLVNDQHVGHVRWDGQRVTIKPSLVADGPQMFTSSGLGDYLVELPRRDLFNQLFHRPTNPDSSISPSSSPGCPPGYISGPTPQCPPPSAPTNSADPIDPIDPANPIAIQDAFHRHHWSDRPQLSVCMRRDDARTVSMTVVERLADRMRMVYYNEAPDVARCPRVIELPIDPAFVGIHD